MSVWYRDWGQSARACTGVIPRLARSTSESVYIALAATKACMHWHHILPATDLWMTKTMNYWCGAIYE